MLNVAVLSSNPGRFEPLLRGMRREASGMGTPCLMPHAACHAVNVVDVRSPVPPALREREAHDAKLAEQLLALDVDLVICLGYLYILTKPMLDAFRGRILNLHDGEPRFPGLHATRDAIIAGVRETRSIIHLVDETLDGGPIVAMSRPYAVAPFVHDAVRAGETKIVKAYAYAQREWMIADAWPALLDRALQQFTFTPPSAVAGEAARSTQVTA